MEIVCSMCSEGILVIQHFDEGPIRYYCGSCANCDKLPVDDRCDNCYGEIDDIDGVYHE